ncbi:MAG TPA: hypothetical protein VEW42_04305 [Candidatus Eisenbacteria bacterium]|nr:hypothetical protein [Candidatus Eisenbacteria bacterium]
MINHKQQVTNNKSRVLYLVSCILDFAAAQQGQALITLLFFVVMGITITSAAVVILVANIQATGKVEQGLTAYYIAESGAEEGLLQVLRNPQYAGSETISVDGGVATMSATQGNPLTILSVGKYNNFIRKVQVQTVYNGGKIQITSWKEIQ